MSMSEVETNDLLERMSVAGFEVSRPQLKRLRREGLVPRPSLKHVIGRAGSVSVYPEDAVHQLHIVMNLKHNLGYETFRELRVGAWLAGSSVEFRLLRPDVVDLLRTAMRSQQHLRPGSEDDGLSRQLRQTLRNAPPHQVAMVERLLGKSESAAERITLDGILLAMLQLAVGTPHAGASSDRLDQEMRIVGDAGEGLTDLYTDWDLPGTPKWPRIVGRSGAKWFQVGRDWLALVTGLISEGAYDEIAGSSPISGFFLDHIHTQLVDLSSAGLEMRTLLACQGIVLARSNPDRLTELVDNLTSP